MALETKRSWKVLLYGLLATILIWALGNLTPVFFDLFLEGEISRTTAVAFLMGLYGVISGGLISILSEKVGFLDSADFAKGRKALGEISGIAADQLRETDDQKELREIVEARKAGMSLEEYKAMKEKEPERIIAPDLVVEDVPKPEAETTSPEPATEPAPTEEVPEVKNE